MKRLLPLFALILVTGCSHSATTTATKSDKPVASNGKAASQSAKVATKPAVAGAVSDKASCKSNDDIRNLEIVTKGEGCAVHYTKHDKMNEIATAEHETQHCKEVMQKIRGHLEAAGFSCN
ncbi:MAG: hypothetical protein ACXVB9_05455 [Bdellovibrionota bacterium]